MEIFKTLVDIGHKILTTMSGLLGSLNTKIADIIPWNISGISVAVPLLGEFLQFSLLDVILGAGIPIIIGYTLVKWLIP